MNTAIVYVSLHHGSTKKLVDAISDKHDVTLIDAATMPTADLSGYDLIGFASGVAFGNLYKQMNAFIEKNLPDSKRVFFLFTCGRKAKDYSAAMQALAVRKCCTVAGSYGCSGFDTYGPFKLVGGLNKGHPDESEIKGAVEFFERLREQ